MANHPDEESKVGADQVGRQKTALRERMQRFARLRAANRALPATASEMPTAEEREARATSLRAELSKLAGAETKDSATLESALQDLDARLDGMQSDFLECFDSFEFVSLRASTPRAVEAHRHEVLAVLEVLLEARQTLLDRLPKVEYLITMLATEEVDGRRNIVHDPVSLTPTLEDFSVASLGSDGIEAEAVAMELYQAATLDSDAPNFSEVLRSIRARKQKIGLGCLSPEILRAVVTYNARMFNGVESLAEASRARDAELDFVLEEENEAHGEVADLEEEDFALDTDQEEAKTETEVEEASAGPISAYDSLPLRRVLEGMRTRLDGESVANDAASRVALVLDLKALEPLEIESIQVESPTGDQRTIALTATVGLMVRDLGSIKAGLEELGIDEADLTDRWVRELNEAIGQLVSEKLGDPNGYDLATKLSGIKSKHLFKPFNALNAANRSRGAGSSGFDASSGEMRQVARAALSETNHPGRRASDKRGGVKSVAAGSEGRFAIKQPKNLVAAALVLVACGLGISNFIAANPSDIKTLSTSALVHTSPYLKAAYRNEEGRGGLLVGRVDSDFEALKIEEKIKAAKEMVERFEMQNIREAMLYDDRGTMQVQYAAGKLNRPRLENRTSMRAPGQSAVRRSLMGKPLDQLEKAESEAAEEDDGWGDES